MTEKQNLHNKTRLLYYQDHPPFHFIAINFLKIFNKCSNLTHVGSQDSAEEFDHHCYEIFQQNPMIPHWSSFEHLLKIFIGFFAIK